MSNVRVIVRGQDVTDRTALTRQVQADNNRPHWTRPVHGNGTWDGPAVTGYVPSIGRVLVILTLGCLAFTGLLLAGQAAICETQDQSRQFCDGYTPKTVQVVR